jgi:two-component system, chemotaxis family, sensor histidine kinase and response regulator PixL
MDTEQQVRLNFLEEAEEYFEQLESILLDLAATDNRSQPLNEALRAAHSIKGSAGMMGFMPLSRVAHRLEDFLKILQARKIVLDVEIETLLLQAVDCLRNVKQMHCDGITVDDAWWDAQSEPIFVRLHDRLGDLTDEDENRLLSAEENVNVELLIFTTGVEGLLEKFEVDRGTLDAAQLRSALMATSNKLLEFGFIGQVESFVLLCESVVQHCAAVSTSEIFAFADAATSLWWQSHALVSLGRMEQLPSQLNWTAAAPITETMETPIDLGFSLEDLNSLQANLAALIPAVIETPANPEFSLEDLNSLQANLAALTIPEPMNLPVAPPVDELAVPGFNPQDLADLQATIAQLDLPEIPEVVESAIPVVTLPKVALTVAPKVAPTVAPTVAPKVAPKVEVPVLAKTRSTKNATVRVPLEQFRQINTLFSSLILERNTIDLRVGQSQALMGLLRDRMQSLEGFNQELRQWYDRASLEGLVTPGQGADSGFDALEMDSYSNLHLMAQAQMETIVKLQEVIADLELTTQEMQQANSSLNYTSRSLQTRITRAQMRPFADLVGKFPRVVRDLSVKYGKQVNLRIEGESTLFERVALDALNDPLNHLLRNAFDHGIESPAARTAEGKPVEGTITLRAMQRGNKAIVTIQDDGKGINFEKIRDRVRQHGIPENRVLAMTDKELVDLIFEAGFSTASQVTELSGRGVGMDVVRSNLKEIQGDIQVETTPGQGSKFIISIPLTLSILRVMVLEAHGLVFAVPIEMVKELTAFPENSTPQVAGETLVAWQNRMISLAMPQQYWRFRSAAKSMEMEGVPVIEHPLLLVVGEDKRYCGIQVQRFWGEQEVAVRPVMSPLPLPEGFSGVTVLADGRIVPMVDPIVLFGAIAQMPEVPAGMPVETVRKAANRILVVDDSVHARRYLAISLEKAGYTVEQAKDGQEAVDRLLAGLQVAAVICDVEMPRLDGYGVLSEIKGRSEFRNLPIAMLTSRSSEKHRRLAMSLGATAYFSKPYNEQELLQTLQELTA